MSSVRFRDRTIAGYQFSGEELRDLLVAWVALAIAFAIFFERGAAGYMNTIERAGLAGLFVPFVVSLVTAGLAFLLHEVAHKIVAVRFGQFAAFRADNSMLFLAIMSAMIGFIFAAPGAVYHRGRITIKEHGLIALAGPVTNLLLMVAFVPFLVLGAVLGSHTLWIVGERAVAINLFLAAFNMIPYGPLDGKTVLRWNKPLWAIVFVPSAIVAVIAVFGFGFGFGRTI